MAAAKSAFPPPPPFFELYTFPPPPPPLSDEQLADARVVDARAKADALRSSAAALLPLDLYAPPPPLHEAFIKFGEVQPAGFMMHEMGPEVTQLFVRTEAAAAAASSAGTVAAASSTAATPVTNDSQMQLIGLPESAGVDFTASLRLLNRQYLQAYLSVLDTLTSAAPATGSSPVASTEPGAHVERALKRLSDIGANLSWLLSQLRPHQAMQTVIQMSMRQIQKRKQMTAEVNSTIAEARSFLSAHGVHYEDGSTNIEPEVNLSAALAKSRIAPSADADTAADSALKQEERMEDDEKQHTAVKLEHGAAARTEQPDPAKQLQAFLDVIPDD